MSKINILVISHNSLGDDTNMGKTLNSLFGAFDKSELSQLYFYSTEPNFDKTNNAYRITDIDSLKSFLKRKNFDGEVKKDLPNNKVLSEKSFEFHKKISRKKSNIIMLLRDTMWALSKVNNVYLKDWIIKINPDIVFFASGDYIFSYRISFMINKIFNIPLVTYFCDDYYGINKFSISPFYYIRKFLLNKAIKKAATISSTNIFISHSMKNKYMDKFNINGKVFHTPSKFGYSVTQPINVGISKITYVGGLTVNRDKTLIKLANSIDKINLEKNMNLSIDVYAPNLTEYLKKNMHKYYCLHYHGYVEPSKVSNVINESDILLHMESFNKNDIIRVKHSISTKISDYLPSKKLILAIGDKSLASINLLKESGAAYVIDDLKSIHSKLVDLITNYDIQDIISIINNANKLYNESFEFNKQTEEFRKYLESIK